MINKILSLLLMTTALILAPAAGWANTVAWVNQKHHYPDYHHHHHYHHRM